MSTHFPNLTLPRITIPYPPGATDHPYDPDSGAQFFIWCRSETFASNDLKFFEEPFNNEFVWKCKGLSVGYTGLSVYAKVACYHGGDLLLSFQPVPKEILKKYWVSPVDTYSLHRLAIDEQGRGRNIKATAVEIGMTDEICKTRAAATTFTIDFSKAHPTELVFLLQELSSTNWH